jgi:hypothetical protein
MPAYRRTTRECSVSQLTPGLRKGFEDFFIEHKLGALAEEALQCCETLSERDTPGMLDSLPTGNPDSTDYLGLILTEQWLLWGRSGDRSGTKIFGAEFKYLKVKRYKSRLSDETGLHIDADLPDFKGRVEGNLALGPEEAARKFCEEAVKAVEKAKPPKKGRKIPWLPF